MGPNLITISKQQVSLFQPLTEQIKFEDIAHALSMQCRYNGHIPVFYSVAEHSCRVSDALPNNLKAAGLLHDAEEAYLGDVITPIKGALPGYKQIADAFHKVIRSKFNIDWHFAAAMAVKDADEVVFATECRDLPASFCNTSTAPLRERIVPWSPQRAKLEFLDRGSRLCLF